MRFVLAALILAVPEAFAEPLSCPPGSEPLIELVQLDEYYFPPAGEFRSASLICRSGRRLGFSSYPTGEGFPIGAGVVLDDISGPAMDHLQAALIVAKIGFQQDCAFAPLAFLERRVRITWFGRRGRHNSFVMSSVAAGPPCSPEALAVYQAVDLQLGARIDIVVFN